MKQEKRVYQLHNIVNQVILQHCKIEKAKLQVKLEGLKIEKDRVFKEVRERLKKQA